jgi:hypothetical protein
VDGPVTIEGQVSRERVARGSKSERSAVTLRTPQGERYVLRRHDGPALGDRALDKLVGRSIQVSGFATNRTLIMRDWKLLED